MPGKYFIGSFSQMGLSGPCRVLLAFMCWAYLCPDAIGWTSTQVGTMVKIPKIHLSYFLILQISHSYTKSGVWVKI
jgi:hypothetical protein